METKIVMAKVDKVDRERLEWIEEKQYHGAREVEMDLGCLDGIEKGYIKIYTLSEFMDACNNEEVILTKWWIGYVKIDN